MPTPAKTPHKNTLDIRLAEDVVFLRAGDATGRRRGLLADAPPGMLRGLLVLNLAKPMRITSIEVELLGKTTTAWPEGVGARRIEISEEHEIYSQSYIFFRAGHTPGSTFRRHLSVGPGLALEHEDEDHSEQSSIMQPEGSASGHGHRGRSPDPREDQQNQRRPHRRYMSVDQTHFQRSFVTHRENPIPTVASPPYTPTYTPNDTPLHLSPSTSISHRARATPPNQSPARSFEDLRRALESEPINGYTRSPCRSASNILSPESRRVSLDEDSEFLVGSSTTQYPSPPHIQVPDGPPSARGRDPEGDETVRGRKNKRFSFASALFEAMVDRVRSRSPYIEQDPARSGYTTPPRGRTLDRTLSQVPEVESPVRKEPSALGKVGEALGLEVDDGREYGDGWKEFRKGVYTYPISFAIPAKSPPSLSVDYGSVTWRLKAVVHRPGAFKSKLTASHDITVVATPGEDDTEESESIIVERQWDSQMQYLIVISGRSFAIGGTIPVSITFMPWTKMKIYRVSVIIEERVDYWTGFKRVARTDPNNRVALLALKYPKKDAPPILPLQTDDPDVFARSPFAEVLDPDADDVGEAMAGFMGPGPWTIRKELPLPGVGGALHATNKNRGSNISVGHMLKLVFRVERGDDDALDPVSGKRKLFDIVVQTPVHILSHLCNPEHTSLPAYSRLPDPRSVVSISSEPGLSLTPMPMPALTPTPASAPLLDATPSAGAIAQRRSVSATRPAQVAHNHNHHHASLSLSAVLPLHHNHNHPQHHHPASAASVSDQSQSQSTSSRSSLSTEPTSPAANSNLNSNSNGNGSSGQEHSTPELFERLVAGQESEEGEAPPSYEAAVTVELAASSGSVGSVGTVGTVLTTDTGTGTERGARTPPVLMVEEHR